MWDWLFGIDREKLGDASEWTLGWRHVPEAWVLVLIIAPAVIGAAWWAYRREVTTAGRRIKVVLATFRVAVLAVLLAILFQPYLSVEREIVRETHVVLLFDVSESMSLKDKIRDAETLRKMAVAAGFIPADGKVSMDVAARMEETPRLELLKRVFQNRALNLFVRLGEHHKTEAFAFDSALHPGAAPEQLAIDTTEGGGLTAIGDALQGVEKKLEGRQLAAVIVFTDGRNNAGIDPAGEARHLRLSQPDVPIYTVGVGDPAEPRDIHVADVKAPPVVQAKDPVSFDVRIGHRGFDGETMPLQLVINDQIKAELGIMPGPEQSNPMTATIQWRPDAPGDYVCRLRVPLQPGEIVEDNNEQIHFLKVVDEKIRVLFVDGYPRWEYRYLKNALIRDRSLQAQCLLLSADYQFPQESSPDELPLTEFPQTFEALHKYDVVILGDVDPDALVATGGPTVEDLLKNLERFVEEDGGGVAFSAGTLNYPRGYCNQPVLEKLLPVQLDNDLGRMVDAPMAEPFRMLLTPAGRVHTVMDLTTNPEEKLQLWEGRDPRRDSLPGLYWYLPVRKAKASATVLATHPLQGDRFGRHPILAVQPVGRGRTLFVGTDETWRWRFLRSDKYFGAFWDQVILYLRGGKLLGGKRFDIKTDKPSYGLRDDVRIEVRARDAHHQEITDPTFPVAMESPSGRLFTLDLTAEPKHPGQYQGSYRPDELGPYRAAVGPDSGPEARERAFATFKVQRTNRETEEPGLDLKTLKAVAAATQDGEYLHLGDVGRLPEILRTKSASITPKVKEDDLWDSPLALLLFTLLLTLEWAIRKWARLL